MTAVGIQLQFRVLACRDVAGNGQMSDRARHVDGNGV